MARPICQRRVSTGVANATSGGADSRGKTAKDGEVFLHLQSCSPEHSCLGLGERLITRGETSE